LTGASTVARSRQVGTPDNTTTDYRLDGSFSLLHTATGFNATFSGGTERVDNVQNPSNLYVKLGWLGELFPVGDSAFAADFTRSTNLPTEDDKGYSAGAAYVQQFEDWGTEAFMQFRWYDLERDAAPKVDDIVIGTVGTRVKF
jgi:hypothetical protein